MRSIRENADNRRVTGGRLSFAAEGRADKKGPQAQGTGAAVPPTAAEARPRARKQADNYSASLRLRAAIDCGTAFM